MDKFAGNEPFRIMNAHSGLVLAVYEESEKSGVAISQEYWRLGKPSHMLWDFRLVRDPDGRNVYEIKSAKSGLYIDAENGKKGETVRQRPHSGKAMQQWVLKYVEDNFGGYWTMKNRASKLLMAIGDRSVEQFSPAIQWPDSAAFDQKWYIERADKIRAV